MPLVPPPKPGLFLFYPLPDGTQFSNAALRATLVYPGVKLSKKNYAILAPLNAAWLVERALVRCGERFRLWTKPVKVQRWPSELRQIPDLRAVDPKTKLPMTEFVTGYQLREAFRTMSTPGVVFRHPAGSGKTLASLIWSLPVQGKIVVVTGAKGRHQWRNQIQRYTTAKVHVVVGTGEAAAPHEFIVHRDLPWKMLRSMVDAWQGSHLHDLGKIDCGCEAGAHQVEVSRRLQDRHAAHGNRLYSIVARVFLPPGEHSLAGLPRTVIEHQRIPQDARFVIVGWEILAYHVQRLCELRPTTTILDESHRGKNHKQRIMVPLSEHDVEREPDAVQLEDGRWVKFVKLENVAASTDALCKASSRRLLLTATLVKDRIRDAWAQLNYLDPWGFGAYWPFARRYCNPPEAPIWMGDLTFKPLGDVRVGDTVMGWSQHYGRRARKHTHGPKQVLARAKVVDVATRTANVVKLTMESGRSLVCTPDHLWRATNHFSRGPDSKNATRNEAIRNAVRGGKSLGAAAAPYGLTAQSAWGIVHGRTFDFLPPKVGRELCFIVNPDPIQLTPEQARAAAWLAGVYDGEGHGSFISQCSEHNPEVFTAIGQALTLLGVKHTTVCKRNGRSGGYLILGGRDGLLRFQSITKTLRLPLTSDRTILVGHLAKRPDKIIRIQPAGRRRVIALTTTTGNYIAWGYASKNCGAVQNVWGGWDDKSHSNLDELAARLSYHDSYVTAEEAKASLPAVRRDVIYLPPDAQQNEDPDLIRELMAASADSGNKTTSVLSVRLAAACSRKRKALVESIVERAAGGAKICVFTGRHHDVDAMSGALKFQLPERVKLFVADGRTPVDDRAKIVAEYMPIRSHAVLVATGYGLGEQIDLNETDIGIIAMLPLTPADLIQWEGRWLRRGSTRALLIEYWVAEGTVDERVVGILLDKLPVVEKIRTEGVQGIAQAFKGDEEQLMQELAQSIIAAGRESDAVAEAEATP